MRGHKKKWSEFAWVSISLFCNEKRLSRKISTLCQVRIFNSFDSKPFWQTTFEKVTSQLNYEMWSMPNCALSRQMFVYLLSTKWSKKYSMYTCNVFSATSVLFKKHFFLQGKDIAWSFICRLGMSVHFSSPTDFFFLVDRLGWKSILVKGLRFGLV